MSNLLKESKVFCMAPWTHLHTWPSGEVYPCCMTPWTEPIGYLQKASIKELWNSAEMREIRKKMLSGEKVASCQRCYELENSDFNTLRQNLNRDFQHHFELVEKTTSSGFVEKVNLPYFDFRFSNICNFRCRSCGPQLSSGWHEDHVQLHNMEKGIPKVVRPTEDPEEFWQQVEPHLDELELVYFAGGEPLLMEEHYRILAQLIERKKTDVLLRYNTNFSLLKFKKYDVLEMWRQFPNVEVGASLDAFGPRAEYMRKGTIWSQIEKNRQRMIKECPHVRFFISPTVSVMNVYQLPEFHRLWVEKSFIEPEAINLNTLLEPPHYRTQILPQKMKDELSHIYQEHIELLKQQNAHRAASGFENTVQFFNAEDRTDEISSFLSRTRKLDKLRNENLVEVCPELEPLMDFDNGH